MRNLFFTIILISILFVNSKVNSQPSQNEKSIKNSFELTSKPFTRYWWFASEIRKEDVKWNLDWLKENGFGGVEIAWVYPLNRNSKTDSSYTPRQEWLSPEWQSIVEYTIGYADSIGLGCDLTFGTLWPFGDSYVPFEQATQKYGQPDWRQKITASWQYPKEGYVIDHLNSKNYLPYFNRLMKTFPRPETKLSHSYFIDSWEVETEKLWADGFAEDFKKRFGYAITPYMDSIYAPYNNRILYDYMSLLSDKILTFYTNYDSVLNSANIFSRGQVSGAPCDLISGYAKLDIPEGESMLFEPEYCSIPASAAVLSGKNAVSSETFTCLYGWPRDYIRQEQTADLKLVADALFANGINHIIWHGKAHNPQKSDSVNFYASTHIGFSGNIAQELPEFNRYLEKVSSYMKKGNTYADIAVYLPTEDTWTGGIMPKEKQFKWAWGYYEMRYVYFPDELAAYNPVWINYEFLQKAVVIDNKLKVGNIEVPYLYVDAKYLDIKVVKRLIELAADGLKIILKNIPENPSAVSNGNEYNYNKDLLKFNKNIKSDLKTFIKETKPFITAKNIPVHWVRKDKEALYVFFPNPKSSRIKFPLEYGQSLNNDTVSNIISINYDGKNYQISLKFEPYQSLLYKLENSKTEQIDIKFVPKTPVQKKRPENYIAPWLVN